ncbi:VCBS repeat-containing protein [candidate division WOR-3 bacterium]|nr:VCBS repeat-containing protein [candidate division WOR-3 bacterium]
MVSRYIIVALLHAALCFSQNAWVETSQSDFRDGIYERNIYASHRGGGAVEFAPRFDLNNDGYFDLFAADRFGPYVRIYWGSTSGYSAGNVTLYPSSGGANCDAADLDGDGYAEFIVSHYFEKTSIYWGSASGPDPQNHLDLPMIAWNRQGVFVADLNKDGYLDIATTQEIVSGKAAIFWGSASGYSIGNRTDLPCNFGIHNIEVADFDQNNWLDILFVVYAGDYYGYILIYWGNDTGFQASNVTVLPGPSGNTGVSVADLNADGYIDIVSTGWYDTQSYLYWGSAGGYSSSSVQILDPGYCYGGSSVADFNNDTYLDILYHRGGYGTACQIIFWGSASGYANSNSSDIGIPLETTGGLIADLDYDGDLDIFVNTRTPEYHSFVLSAPSFTPVASLPVIEDHHAMFREIGNVYNREYHEDYGSSVFDAGAAANWGVLEWEATTPTGSSVLCWVRSGNAPLPDSSWSDWQPMANGGAIPDVLNARFLQYRARLSYTNPCYLPSLNEVSVTYESAISLIASLRITPETINLQSHGKFTAFITLPAGYDHRSIDVSTVCCHGANASSGHATPNFYIAKFSVQDLVGVIPGPAVEFVVTGQLFNGTDFIGYDTVRVIGVPSADVACRPNPFKTKTTISVVRAEGEKVRIKIYDVSGKLVRTFDQTQCRDGTQSVEWDRTDNSGRRVAAGIYLYHVEGIGSVSRQKIIVLD